MLNVNRIDLFYGASQALKKVSIDAEPGKVTCVMGRNGVGKTSLMRVIAGLDQPTTGKIFMDGLDVTGVPVQQLVGHRVVAGVFPAVRAMRLSIVDALSRA